MLILHALLDAYLYCSHQTKTVIEYLTWAFCVLVLPLTVLGYFSFLLHHLQILLLAAFQMLVNKQGKNKNCHLKETEIIISNRPLKRMLSLRLRYIRANVNRMLKRIANPRSAPVPIQNQFLSGKTLKFSSTATPNLVFLSDACSRITYCSKTCTL